MHVPSPSAEKDRARTAALAALAGQLTDAKRDASGLVAEIASSVTGRVDRAVRIARDGHDRVTRIDYGNGEVETFAYDRWGRLAAHTRGRLKETYAYDHFGRLVEKAENGTVFAYAYDAAGRLVKEGDRTCRYGYPDKVLSVAGGGKSFTYSYHADGQLARADYGGGRSEDFLWDGLALVRRGGEQFVNEPHPGNAPKKLRFEGKPRAERSARRDRKGSRGSPVLSSEGVAYLNDLLGTTVGVRDGPRGRRRHTPAALTAFGEYIYARIDNRSVQSCSQSNDYHRSVCVCVLH